MGKIKKNKKAKTPTTPDKCPKAWEKARRDRIKILFDELSRLLPKYDPALPPSRPEVIQKAMVYIRDLQAENEELLNGGFDEVYRKKIENWKRRVKDLVLRVEQLSNILRTANIHLPPLALEGMPAWATNRPKHWTEKLNLDDDKIDELIKKLADPKTKKPKKKKILKKKKPDAAKNKENPTSEANVVIPQTTQNIIPNITQSGTFLLTNEGNLLPVITPTANVLTPVIINRPAPVLVLQAQPQPRPLPILISKVAATKRRIVRESTVMTFSNKRPISALSKQSHNRRGGKCIAHKTGNSELQPTTTASAVSPTAAFLNSFPVVTTPKIVTSEESETNRTDVVNEPEEIPVEKEIEKEKEPVLEEVTVEKPKTPELPKIPEEPKIPELPIIKITEPTTTVAEIITTTTAPTTTEIRTWETATQKTAEISIPTENYPAITFPSTWSTPQPPQTNHQNSWLIPPIYSNENKTWRPMEPTWTNSTEPWKVTTAQQTNFKIGLYETTTSSNQFASNCESTWSSSQETFIQSNAWNNQPKQTKKKSLKLTPIVSYGVGGFPPPPPPLLQTTEPYTFVSDASSYAAKTSFALDVSKFNESYGLTVPKTPVCETNFFTYQSTCAKNTLANSKVKNPGYGKSTDTSLWNPPYLGQSGNEIWNQFDYSYSGISEPKENRPKPPINWMTEPEPTEDNYRQKDAQILDFCFNADDEKARNRKKDGEGAQDYFGWVSMKVDPLVVPSTLPTLVGDLALGLVNDPVPAKKCKPATEKNEPFANLSKNIFDNENPKQETIVLKNIFELPASGSKQRSNQTNNFLSVSQLVEPQETKSDYIYYNQRTKGKRTSGWKCEKKCQQAVKCSSYTAEALMRPSEQEQEYTFPLEFHQEPVLDHTELTAMNQQTKLKTYTAVPRKPDYWRQEQNLMTKTKKTTLPVYPTQPANLNLTESYPRFPTLPAPQNTPEPFQTYPGPRKPYICQRPATKTTYPYPTDNRKSVGKLQQSPNSYTKMINSPSLPYTVKQSPNPPIGPSYPGKPALSSPNPTYSTKAPVKSQPNPVIGSHLSYLSKCPPTVQNPVIGSTLPSYPTFPSLPSQTPNSSGGSSLANFNLSTIFPEMNKKGFQYS